MAPPPTPNADRLAQEMRVLAANPRDARALISAGELSAKLDDPAAALQFFKRAETVDPRNPRILAGRAAVLVRMERPGEALRLFERVRSMGLTTDAYAADRGFAYDLIGAPDHAQREYKTAMRLGTDDDLRRRYALSLGISGKRDEAMTMLDPLLRRSDRAAWRARAFILAMTGDVAGADRIAASMMPAGMGAALAPFFRRLPSMSAADRAYAVHFGELTRSATHLADARMAPPLSVMAPERPVVLATVAPASVGRSARREREPRRERAADRRVIRAAARTAARASDRAPEPRTQIASVPDRQSEPGQTREVSIQPAPQSVELATVLKPFMRTTPSSTLPTDAARQMAAVPVSNLAMASATSNVAPAPASVVLETPPVVAAPAPTPEATSAGTATSVIIAPPAAAPIGIGALRPDGATPIDTPASTASDGAGSRSAASVSTPAATPSLTGSTQVEAAPRPEPTPARIGGEDTVLAKIIAGITIPASELGIEPMPGRADTASPLPAPAPAPVETSAPATETVRPPATASVPAAKPAKGEAAPTKPATAKKAPVPADVKSKSKTPAKPDPAKAEPVRHWVQVAGGADASAFGKQWKAVIAKAPAAFKGKQPWTTPLRATNRLLTGPFKTAAEAQAFVNQIAKDGLSAFAFASVAGQKVERVAVK